MKFKKVVFGAAAAITLASPVVAPSVASANSTQQNNVQTEITSQRNQLTNSFINIFNSLKGQLVPVVQSYQPQSNDGKEVKSSILQAANSSKSEKEFKSNFKKSLKQEFKQQNLSQKQQLKQLKEANKELKQFGSSELHNSSTMRIAKRWTTAALQISDGKQTVQIPQYK